MQCPGNTVRLFYAPQGIIMRTFSILYFSIASCAVSVISTEYSSVIQVELKHTDFNCLLLHILTLKIVGVSRSSSHCGTKNAFLEDTNHINRLHLSCVAVSMEGIYHARTFSLPSRFFGSSVSVFCAGSAMMCACV